MDMRTVWWGGAFFVAGVVLQKLWLELQRRWKLSQAQKSYGVGIDVPIKESTPSMGGVVFLVLALAALFISRSLDDLLFWSLPLAGGAIGLTDDLIKFISRSSEGFRSLRKLYVQLIATAVWLLAIWFFKTPRLWPGLDVFPLLTLAMAHLGSVGMMNAVNITDGLDGLAGGCFLISLGVLCVLLPATPFNLQTEAVLFAIVSSFLFYNLRPAQTFMGDTGAHFLGGALAALCVQNGMILALIPAGFLFGIELLSSAVQILAIRKFNRKIFNMAPLHHHFQRQGWDETKVTTRFWLVQAVGAAWLSALFVALWGL
ncbi:MAG: phospho-N-acetylmuramoyl-pentapeptide-transferase [Fretibacterium sp.]|nr:phospho-N-acetylmuramoyl-pentapeptide-transferase [Fretibacterium sp.]